MEDGEETGPYFIIVSFPFIKYLLFIEAPAYVLHRLSELVPMNVIVFAFEDWFGYRDEFDGASSS